MRLARSTVLSVLALIAVALPASSAQASPPSPAWSLSVVAAPANLPAGSSGHLFAKATNVGGGPTAGPTRLTLALPAGLTATSAQMLGVDLATTTTSCAVAPAAVTCETPTSLASSKTIWVAAAIEAAPSAPAAPLVQAKIESENSAEATASGTVAVQSDPLSFGFLYPARAPLTEADGSPATLAGSHPYQQTISFEFPTRQALEGPVIGSGHVRDVHVDLPAGLIGDPAASPVLCTEAQLEGPGCPLASAIGTLETPTYLLSGIGISSDPLYNMVPPPGYPAELAANVAGVGIFAHLLPSVRSDGDYGISVDVPGIIALPTQPVFGSTSQIWGDPSSPLHDPHRGNCGGFTQTSESCPVEPQQTAFWTLPSRCDGRPLVTKVSADDWEEPGVWHSSSYASADLGGSPVSLTGCGELEFAPTISVAPTTDLADSPSGLDVDLHQPQDTDKEHRATPPLRDAGVTLPEGMSVNPSQADGLGVCTDDQIGLLAEDEEPGIHFDKTPNSCPDAAKLGTTEVTTPLLAERDAEHRLETDPETGRPILRPLHGAVYLAKPFANPFGSLLALYLTVEDPESGTFVKFAGEVRPDPATGRLTTVFKENPQLPIEDIRLHLFGGARGALITPLTCGAHTTTTDLEPWSAPETPDAHPQSSFQTTAEPGGGSCPGGEAQAPNSPSFQAGTLNPQAGAYSPFVLKVGREDGSQRLTGIDTTLAPGLLGRLAGIGECSDAQIARAQGRSRPEEGVLERQDPSCPASTEVGTVTVAAGAGPTPFYTQGHAYLAGPYKGAPVSLVTIVPAIAGPFDLGTVVTRVALHVDPVTAQINAVSDPLPTILDGIPLDLRSIALKMDRPGFTLNPTSCDPLSITGQATSALGQAAALTTPFQVGGCQALPFRPRLSLRLKGKVRRTAHPRLIATLRAREGEANIARAQVKLPPAAFIDQGHIRTVCTRVQWAADACPAGSVYGRAEATTPLLGYPLSGSVYLRSSSHKLPDLVVKLAGPASQPIEIDLDGKTDSVKGALRNTFEAVPDAPVSTFRLELFGGKRGLVEMSGGFCKNRHAAVDLTGQNGKLWQTTPVVGAKCPKGKAKKHGKHKHRHPKRG